MSLAARLWVAGELYLLCPLANHGSNVHYYPFLGKESLIMEYTLVLNSKQVAVLRRACEILSRLHMLQFDIVLEEVLFSKEIYDRRKEMYGDESYEKDRQVKEIAEYLKQLLAPELHPNAYYGIGSDKISGDSSIAYDLQQVLRHCQSWVEFPPDKDRKGFLGVSYDTPMKFGSEPLARITVDKERENV